MKNKIDSDYGYIGNGEVQYVYRYIHPNYPWLYVGRTDDLTRRINEHDKGLFDNIDEEYKNLLLESFVVYTEINNKTQAIVLENYLIDVYKPTLNKFNKYYGESVFDIYEINWKKYIRTSDFVSCNNNNNNDDFNIGKYIKAQRINMGYTLKELENITNISRRTISRIETGNINFSFESIVTILKALNIFDVISDSLYKSVCLNNRLRVRKND